MILPWIKQSIDTKKVLTMGWCLLSTRGGSPNAHRRRLGCGEDETDGGTLT